LAGFASPAVAARANDRDRPYQKRRTALMPMSDADDVGRPGGGTGAGPARYLSLPLLLMGPGGYIERWEALGRQE
jgi:hypothetical protein